MSEFLTNWMILVSVFTIAVISPGPDFVVSVRNSLTYGQRAGIMTAIGFAGGVGIHVTYCLLGLATIISQSVLLFSLFKYIGAGYLIYMGFMALRSKGFQSGSEENVMHGQSQTSDLAMLRSGFVTNLFNPKATLFFMALFTQIIQPGFDLWVSFVYGATCVVMTFIWFSIVATILNRPQIKARFIHASKWIDRICGGALLALGLRLALTKMAPHA